MYAFSALDIPPRETLFHFAARLGLQQVTEFFMYQPGSLDALSLQNNTGQLPIDIDRIKLLHLVDLKAVARLEAEDFLKAGPRLAKTNLFHPTQFVLRRIIAHGIRMVDGPPGRGLDKAM